MGLSYTGRSCFEVTSVSGCKRVPEPPARMMPLRDMAFLCADQRPRDAIRLLSPRSPVKTENARELAAVENGVGRATGGGREVPGSDRGHARRAACERRLCGN